MILFISTSIYGFLSYELVLYVSSLLRAFVMELKVYLDNSRMILFHLEMFKSITSAWPFFIISSYPQVLSGHIFWENTIQFITVSMVILTPKYRQLIRYTLLNFSKGKSYFNFVFLFNFISMSCFDTVQLLTHGQLSAAP